MRAWIMVLLIAGGCDRSPRYEATGTVVFTDEAVAGSNLPAFFATQSEILRSNVLGKRVADDLRLDGGADRSHIAVQRRGDSLVMEVRVSARDRQLAATLCNTLLSRYLEHRIELKVRSALERRQWLASQLDGLKPDAPEASALKQQLAQAQLDSQLRMNDARLLDPCR